MKLSEMNTAQLATCLCRIAEPVGRIGRDARLNDYFRDVAQHGEGDTVFERITGMAAALIPVMLDTHLEDMLCILSALTGKSERALREQNGLLTIREAVQSIDGEILAFFRLPGSTSAGT